MTPDFDSMLRQINTLNSGIAKLKLDNATLNMAVKLSHQYISTCVRPPLPDTIEATTRNHVMTLLTEAMEIGGEKANAA